MPTYELFFTRSEIFIKREDEYELENCAKAVEVLPLHCYEQEKKTTTSSMCSSWAELNLSGYSLAKAWSAQLLLRMIDRRMAIS